MRYKRDEPFRYTFGTPIQASFQIAKMDHDFVTSSKGEARIIDISPQGLRMKTTLNLPNRPIELAITFMLNEKVFHLYGEVVWKKQIGINYDYGLYLQVDDDEKNELITQLKIYSKNAMTRKTGF